MHMRCFCWAPGSLVSSASALSAAVAGIKQRYGGLLVLTEFCLLAASQFNKLFLHCRSCFFLFANKF